MHERPALGTSQKLKRTKRILSVGGVKKDFNKRLPEGKLWPPRQRIYKCLSKNGNRAPSHVQQPTSALGRRHEKRCLTYPIYPPPPITQLATTAELVGR